MEDDPPEPPRARYRVLRQLGEGGMGEVLLADDRRLDRPVALKRLLSSREGSALAAARLRREARAMARLHHPNVVEILGLQEGPDGLVLVCEYVEGQDLGHRLARRGPLSLEGVVRLAADLGSGLDAIHEAGMLHRDLKPGNVILEAGTDRAKIMDLGLARVPDLTVLTAADAILGTPLYLPPEALEGAEPGPAWDLYQVGAILFEALTGTKRVEGRELREVLTRIQAGRLRPPPEDLPVPHRVWRQLEIATHLEPDHRHGSGGELARRLEEAARSTTDAPAPTTPTAELPRSQAAAPSRGPPPRPRSRLALGGLAAVATLAAIGHWLDAGDEEPGTRPGERGREAPSRPPPVATRLAPLEDGRLLLGLRRHARVGWAGERSPLRELDAGRHPVPRPGRLTDPLELRWVDGRGEGEARLALGQLVPALTRPLEPWRDHPLDGSKRLEGEPGRIERLRAHHRTLTTWVPLLLRAPLPRPARAELWRTWETSFQVLAGTRKPLDLDGASLPAGVAGSHAPGASALDGGRLEGSFEEAASEPEEQDGVRTLGRDLGPGLLSASERRRALHFRWPGIPPGADRVRIQIEVEAFPPHTQLALEPEDSSGVVVHLFLLPTPAGRGVDRVLGATLPADLCPAPGTRVRVRLLPFLDPRSGSVRLAPPGISWSPPGSEKKS